MHHNIRHTDCCRMFCDLQTLSMVVTNINMPERVAEPAVPTAWRTFSTLHSMLQLPCREESFDVLFRLDRLCTSPDVANHSGMSAPF